MTIWVVFALVTMGAVVGWLLFRAGRTAERDRRQKKAIENVQKAAEVRRAVDSEPDPVERLRDKWTE